jgi:hypothetical protein
MHEILIEMLKLHRADTRFGGNWCVVMCVQLHT